MEKLGVWIMEAIKLNLNSLLKSAGATFKKIMNKTTTEVESCGTLGDDV